MLFQHDDASAASRARRVVVGVLLAQEIVPREVGGVTAEKNAVPGLARADGYRLKEFAYQAVISPIDA